MLDHWVAAGATLTPHALGQRSFEDLQDEPRCKVLQALAEENLRRVRGEEGERVGLGAEDAALVQGEADDHDPPVRLNQHAMGLVPGVRRVPEDAGVAEARVQLAIAV